jgi:hypothetical protein
MKPYITLILAALALSGCVKDPLCVKGIGPIVEETILVEEFHSINLQGSMNVEISYGEQQAVVAEGNGNIIEEMETEVINGTWYISLGTGCFYDFDLKVFITLPDIKKMELSGSGDILATDLVGHENVIIDNRGSGKIFVNEVAETSSLDVKISGSGPVEIKNSWPDLLYMNIINSGSGQFRGYPATVPECNIKVSGSGNCEITVEDLLDVNITGSGNVYYKGRPVVNVNNSGSGRLISRN